MTLSFRECGETLRLTGRDTIFGLPDSMFHWKHLGSVLRSDCCQRHPRCLEADLDSAFSAGGGVDTNAATCCKESCRTPTLHEQTGRLRATEGCEILSVHSSGNTFVTKTSSTAKVHGVLNKNAGSGSSGCISVRSCFSAAAAVFRECGASGSASTARTCGP